MRERAQRREDVLRVLRAEWHRRPRRPVTVTTQDGRRRPKFVGIVLDVATSGAFVLLGDEQWKQAAAEERSPLHVPVDVIRSVRP